MAAAVRIIVAALEREQSPGAARRVIATGGEQARAWPVGKLTSQPCIRCRTCILELPLAVSECAVSRARDAEGPPGCARGDGWCTTRARYESRFRSRATIRRTTVRGCLCPGAAVSGLDACSGLAAAISPETRTEDRSIAAGAPPLTSAGRRALGSRRAAPLGGCSRQRALGGRRCRLPRGRAPLGRRGRGRRRVRR